MQNNIAVDLKLCRICLNNTGTILLFDRHNYIQQSEKLMKCVNIVIAEGDGFPNTICGVCAQELAIAYEFVCKCESSDNVLRSKEFVYQTEEKVSHLLVKQELSISMKEEVHEGLYGLAEQNVETKNIFQNFQTTIATNDYENPPEGQVKAFYPCEICSSMFLEKDSLNKHKSTHHRTYKKSRKCRSGKPSQCGVCGLILETQTAMIVHFRTHKQQKDEPAYCRICDLTFKIKSSLNRHNRLHHCEKYVCDICGREFTAKMAIIAHIKYHQNQSNIPVYNNTYYYACKLCPKKYRQASSLLRHKLSHTGERPHSCPICQKSFHRKYDVQRHIKSMHNEGHYICHLCNKVLKNENLYTRHIRLHRKLQEQC